MSVATGGGGGGFGTHDSPRANAHGAATDEATANAVAEHLFGADNIEAALAALQKAWTAKEKTLRLEYGKIPAPGVGSASGPTLTKEQLDAMSYLQRVKFANKYPDEYAKLTGRT